MLYRSTTQQATAQLRAVTSRHVNLRHFSRTHTLPTIRLYTKPDCTLCLPVKFILKKLQTQSLTSILPAFITGKSAQNFTYEEIDISQPQHQQYNELYKHDIPVVELDGKEIGRHRLSEKTVVEALKHVMQKLDSR